MSSIDIQLAKLKVLQNDIKAQEQTVEKLKETGKNLIRNETTGKQSLQEIKQRSNCSSTSMSLLNLIEINAFTSEIYFNFPNFREALQSLLEWLSKVEPTLH
jgi:hypothetical protein